MDSLVQNRLIKTWAWLPIPLLLLSMIGLWWANLNTLYPAPYLLQGLNVLISVPVTLFIAYGAWSSFLWRGAPGLLLLGCGILFWGGSAPIAGAFLAYGPEVAVTIHNVLVWLAAVCHLMGVILTIQRWRIVRWRELWLAGSYVGVLIGVTIVVLATLLGAMPVFFTQGEGGTFFRYLVLGSTVAMLTLTAALLHGNRRRAAPAFQYWYALGLLLIAVGLFGVMIQSSIDSALGWTGRIAQYLGSVYLMVAAMVTMREVRAERFPLEATLGETRQRIEDLLDLAVDGIVVHERVSENTPGYFLQVNPAICALLGYTAEEMRTLTPLDIIVPEDLQKIPADTEELQTRSTLRHEKTLVAKDGRRIPVEINTRQYQRQGRAMALSMIRDISERKRAEAAVRESEHFKRAILDAVPAHVAVLDRQGVIVAVNEPWRQFATANSDSAGHQILRTGIGVNYLEICGAAAAEGADGAEEVLDGIKAVLEGRSCFFFHEYPCHSPQVKRWFNLIVTPLIREQGGAVISHSDITIFRQLTEDLRHERDIFTRIAAAVPGVICSFRLRPDGSTCFPYASPAIENLYGLRPADLIDSSARLWAIFHPDDLGHLDESIMASARTMTLWRDEFRAEHPIKGEIWVEGHSTPVREPDGGIIWHGYIHDITERKRAEAALRAALDEKEVLLREIHHRVKNNLAVIISLLELQQEGVTEASTADQLRELRNRASAMALVHQMLYQSGSLNQIDFQNYMQVLIEYLRQSFDPQGAFQIQVTVPLLWMNIDTAVPCGLIINELVTNAFKHAFPDPASRTGVHAGEITITAGQEDTVYTVTVADNGVGLPAHLDWTTTRTLGLRLVRMLGQHQLRGQVEFDSTQGTRCTLRFSPRPIAKE